VSCFPKVEQLRKAFDEPFGLLGLEFHRSAIAEANSKPLIRTMSFGGKGGVCYQGNLDVNSPALKAACDIY